MTITRHTNFNQHSKRISVGEIVSSILKSHFYGASTLSKDSLSLYLFLQGNISGDINLKGLKNKIEEISVLGRDIKLSHKIVGKISWSSIPGLVYILVPAGIQDPYVTVLKVRLDKPIQRYNGKGGLSE